MWLGSAKDATLRSTVNVRRASLGRARRSKAASDDALANVVTVAQYGD